MLYDHVSPLHTFVSWSGTGCYLPVAKYTGMDIVASAGSMTSGLVGEMQPKVLPPVPVVATLALTVTVMLVSHITQ